MTLAWMQNKPGASKSTSNPFLLCEQQTEKFVSHNDFPEIGNGVENKEARE